MPSEAVVFRNRDSGGLIEEVLVIPVYGRATGIAPIEPDWAVAAGEIFLANPFLHQAGQRFTIRQPWNIGIAGPLVTFAGSSIIEFALVAAGYRTACLAPDSIGTPSWLQPEFLQQLDPDLRAKLLMRSDPYNPSLQPLDRDAAVAELQRTGRILARDRIAFTVAAEPQDSWLCPAPQNPQQREQLRGYTLAPHEMALRFTSKERALINNFIARGLANLDGGEHPVRATPAK